MRYSIITNAEEIERETEPNSNLSDLLVALCTELGNTENQATYYIDISLDERNIDYDYGNETNVLTESSSYDIHLDCEGETDIPFIIKNNIPLIKPSWFVIGLSVVVKDNKLWDITVNYEDYIDIRDYINNVKLP